MSKLTATVIGAGIQGCMIALQLDRLGHHVNLIDKNQDIYNRTSLNQEGKVHTGMIYALDESHNTANKMIEDALQFAPIIEQLTQRRINWTSITSTPFTYLVDHKSLWSADRLEEKYAIFQKIFIDALKNHELHYLGERPTHYYRQADLPKVFKQDGFQRCFISCEKAVDPSAIKDVLKNCIYSRSNIKVYLRHEVYGCLRHAAGFRTVSRNQERGDFKIDSDIVINSTWEGKPLIDQLLGIENEQSWSVRLKLGFRVRQTVGIPLPTFVIVHGPFGDFVRFPRSGYEYLSWYPSCRIGHTSGSKIPTNWEDILGGSFDSIDIDKIKRDSADAVGNLAPGIELTIQDILAGTIVARGKEDIDVIGSELHHRSEEPIQSYDGYFSINTGKFTSAPNNARKLGQML